MPQTSAQIRDTVDDAVQQASWIVRILARVGYAARGIIYLLIGVLTALGTAGAGHGVGGSEGAFEAVVQEPLGKIILIAAAVGFFGFAVSYLIQAIARLPRRQPKTRSLAIRGSYLISAAIYIGLVVSAIRILLRGVHGNETRDSSQWIMSHPLGRWILGCVGLSVIGFGLFELWRGMFTSLTEQLKLREMGQRMQMTLLIFGRVGVIARGLVFTLIGGFFMVAAWNNNARQARTIGGALRFVERQPYGPWLTAIVAAGLMAYGLFELAESRYRKLD
jgi:hypothetical protein